MPSIASLAGALPLQVEEDSKYRVGLLTLCRIVPCHSTISNQFLASSPSSRSVGQADQSVALTSMPQGLQHVLNAHDSGAGHPARHARHSTPPEGPVPSGHWGQASLATSWIHAYLQGQAVRISLKNKLKEQALNIRRHHQKP